MRNPDRIPSVEIITPDTLFGVFLCTKENCRQDVIAWLYSNVHRIFGVSNVIASDPRLTPNPLLNL